MLERIVRIGLVVIIVAACFARRAAAQSVGAATIRESRRVSIGFSPAWPWMSEHDYTAPLPALRLSANLSTRLAIDLTGGIYRYSDYGGWSLVDIGARWFFAEGNGSPYVMGRLGRYMVDGEETPDRTYDYKTLGVGAEYAADGGFAAWTEIGPAIIGGNFGAYFSAGLGFRFGSRPQRGSARATPGTPLPD